MNSTNQPKVRSRWRRFLRLMLVLFLLFLAALVMERYRGRWALNAWKERMTAKGEVLEITKLWPPPSAVNLEFTNRVAQVNAALPSSLGKYLGQLADCVPGSAGRARRGSQEPRPLLNRSSNSTTGDWDELNELVREAEPALRTFRQLVQDPPRSLGYDISRRSFWDPLPFVPVRSEAQMLQVAAMSELHRGNLAGARENLVALSACARLYENDPTLVCFMIRVAITGIGVGAHWDALEAEGWTEPQLAGLQRAWQSIDLLPRMCKTAEAERAGHLWAIEAFRSCSYNQWIDHCEALYKGYGMTPPTNRSRAALRAWRHWVFHPIWKFAWADQEELCYLQHSQEDLQAMRAAVREASWPALKGDWARIHRSFRFPTASWRFYNLLPPVEDLNEIVGTPKTDGQTCPYGNYSRAHLLTMKNQTLHGLVATAIALKRYELRNGKRPASLDALVPDFLPQVPRDYMDGQRLRYRLGADGSFRLYSVGGDGVDDGGAAAQQPVTGSSSWEYPWDGHDWVWPRS